MTEGVGGVCSKLLRFWLTVQQLYENLVAGSRPPGTIDVRPGCARPTLEHGAGSQGCAYLVGGRMTTRYDSVRRPAAGRLLSSVGAAATGGDDMVLRL